MKKFSAIIVTTFFTLLACTSLIIISCNRNSTNILSGDKCKATSCAYGGVCVDGVCVCKPGYEGNNCEIISKAKFLGSWNVKEDGSVTERAEYGFVIEADTAATAVRLKNFYNYFKAPVMATITKDTIIIPNQQLEGKVVFGKGYIYTDSPGVKNGKISMRYQVVDVASQLVNDFGYYGDVTMSAPSDWSKQQ
jgi:hypothetical protein